MNYCVVVNTYWDVGPFPDNPGVYGYASENEAVAACINALLEASILSRDSDGKLSNFHGTQTFESHSEALEWYQDQLGGSEYFHVYPISKARS